MSQVTHLSLINDEGVREKREIVDSGGRTLIEDHETKIIKIEDSIKDLAEGSTLMNDMQANCLYSGRNIEEVFNSEIENGYADVWEYLADRVDLSKTIGKKAYSGLRIDDYVGIQIGANVHPYAIGGLDYDRGCCNHEQGPSILMYTRMAFPNNVQWNTTNDNNGTAAEHFPYLASNVYSYLINTLLPTFPANVRAVMKERIALIEERYSASGKLTDSTSWDYRNIGRLWLPDEGEVYGCIYWGSKYGSGLIGQLPCFKQPSDRIFRKPDGQRSYVWLRSVNAGYSTGACHVTSTGSATSHSASNAGVGVAPCFYIG